MLHTSAQHAASVNTKLRCCCFLLRTTAPVGTCSMHKLCILSLPQSFAVCFSKYLVWLSGKRTGFAFLASSHFLSMGFPHPLQPSAAQSTTHIPVARQSAPVPLRTARPQVCRALLSHHHAAIPRAQAAGSDPCCADCGS